MAMNKKSIFLAVLASAMLAACSNDSESSQVADDGVIRLATGSMDVTASTRSASQSLLASQFDNGDEVDIFIKDAADKEPAKAAQAYPQPLVYTADGSGSLSRTVMVHWPPYKRSIHVWGVYPKGAAGTDADATDVAFAVQQDQSADAGYKASDLMTGVATTNPWPQAETPAENTVTLKFTHLLSKVNVNLSKTEATTDITDAMMKTAQVYLLNAKPATVFTPKSTAVDKADANGTPFTEGICVLKGASSGACIVVPQDMIPGADFIKIVIGTDTFIIKVPAAGFSFEPQKQHTLSIQLHKANILLTTSIEAWGDGTPLSGQAPTIKQ